MLKNSISSENIIQLGFWKQCGCRVDPGPSASLAITGVGSVVPADGPQGNQGLWSLRRKPVEGPKSKYKKTKFNQEIALWLGLVSGFLTPDQTIDICWVTLYLPQIRICWVFLHRSVFLCFLLTHVRPRVSFALLHGNALCCSPWLSSHTREQGGDVDVPNPCHLPSRKLFLEHAGTTFDVTRIPH